MNSRTVNQNLHQYFSWLFDPKTWPGICTNISRENKWIRICTNISPLDLSHNPNIWAKNMQQPRSKENQRLLQLGNQILETYYLCKLLWYNPPTCIYELSKYVFSSRYEEMLNQGYVRSNRTFKIGFPPSFIDKMRDSQRPITLRR